MSHSLRVLPNYTYQDYLRWEGRWEIIDGIAFDMSPMPSPVHQRIASRLNTVLQNSIDKTSCYCHVYQPIDLKISENTVVNPDLLIICEDVTTQYYDKPPSLVIEIISPVSRLKDTYTKFELYQGFGIKYYIIVDAEDKSIKTFQLISGAYVQISARSKLEIELKDGCVIKPNFEDIFT
ncbi:MAG: Uma2 family endonuclease [Saprospiraceae bacterium]|jgi:Uma2 family endonuclease|nr:Uma2 family endonuclease [Saprospiraceae bacterium]